MAKKGKGKSNKNKRKMIVDFTGVEAFVNAKVGRQAAKIIDGSFKKSKEEKKPMLELVFEVSVGEAKATVKRNFMLSGKGLFFLKKLYLVLGLPTKDGQFTVDIDKLIGKELVVDIEERKHEGKTYPEVSEIHPLSALSEDEDDDDDEDWDDEDEDEDDDDEDDEDEDDDDEDDEDWDDEDDEDDDWDDDDEDDEDEDDEDDDWDDDDDDDEDDEDDSYDFEELKKMSKESLTKICKQMKIKVVKTSTGKFSRINTAKAIMKAQD